MAGSNKKIPDVAVIAAAGSGTRLLPLTFHQPKAMVAIADRPLIHYVVDQIGAAGIKKIVIVIRPEFRAIRKYTEYQSRQKEWKKYKFIIVEKASADFADSIMAAKKHVGKSNFLVATCDDVIDSPIPPLATLKKLFGHYKKPMMILRKIAPAEASNYGVISGDQVAKDIWKIRDVVEKPLAKAAPSNLGAIGDYILTPEIFDFITKARKKSGGKKEVSIIDALQLYCASGEELLGWVFRGKHFDGGSKVGILKASLYFGSKHSEFGKPFAKYLRSL